MWGANKYIDVQKNVSRTYFGEKLEETLFR
jgi:hypothetical protein